MRPRLSALILGVLMFFTAGAAQAQSDYKIRSGDTLTIEVLEDPGLNRSVAVLPDGRFSFPYAGTVRARGRTIRQVESAVSAAISDNFSISPTVFVSVQPKPDEIVPPQAIEPDIINVYFLGEVNTPGIRPVAPGTTLLQALSQSGGMTRFAATKRIQLRRSDSNGQQTIFSIDYKAVLQDAAQINDFTLREGDMVLVPQRRLFE